MDKKKTGELIKEARVAQGYTQQELGDLVGVSNKAVSRWENGESFPDIAVFESLANVLHLKIADIVLGQKDAENSEAVVDEIVRAATISAKQSKRKKLLTATMIVLIVLWIIMGLHMIDGWFDMLPWRPMGFHLFLQVLICLIVSSKMIVNGDPVIRLGDKLNCWLTLFSLFSMIYSFSLMGIVLWRLLGGKTFFNMAPYVLGPFLNNQLIILFYANVIIVAVMLIRHIHERQQLQAGIFPAIGAIYLSYVYSFFLHRMDDVAGSVYFFVKNTVTEYGITIIAIIVTALCIRLRHKKI
ncbi:MAG: helix-turn-helix domain-containing protein [Acetatifactor sp.]|nr:helix-turn-helix domain-containing protein [Acetatifactor sp.]